MTARTKAIVATLGLTAALAVVVWRVTTNLNVPGAPQTRRYAMQDFRDVVYYPAAAFLAGDNPYDRTRYFARYPVGQAMALYPPSLLLIDTPLALLPYRSAEVVYFSCAVVLTGALAALSLALAGVRPTFTRVAGLGAVLVLTRPGHWNLFTGQVTSQIVLAALIALGYAEDRPWLAGLALALTTVKPTYGLPVSLLLLVRGAWRPVAIGAVCASLLTALALTRLVYASGGPSAFVASVETTYAARDLDPRRLQLSPTRVDVVAAVARVTGHAPDLALTFALTLSVLGFAAVGLRRLARIGDRDACLHAVNLACLAVVLCTYHQQYDLLILTPALVTLVWRRDAAPWRGRPTLRTAALALLALPLVNFVASDTGVRALGLTSSAFIAVTSVDVAAVLATLAIFGGLALAAPRAVLAGGAGERVGADVATAPARSASRP